MRSHLTVKQAFVKRRDRREIAAGYELASKAAFPSAGSSADPAPDPIGRIAAKIEKLRLGRGEKRGDDLVDIVAIGVARSLVIWGSDEAQRSGRGVDGKKRCIRPTRDFVSQRVTIEIARGDGRD